MAAFQKPARAGAAFLALASLSLLTSACGGSSKPPPTRARTTPLVSIFEAQPQLLANPGPTLDELRRLGVGVVRVSVPWASFAPRRLSRTAPRRFDGSDPAAYAPASWTPYDAIVRAAHARGVAVYLTLGGPAPLWAAGRDVPRGTNPSLYGFWKPAAVPYGAFARAVGTRYSGRYRPAGAGAPLPRVSIWSLWNEPNNGPQLAPQATLNSSVETSAGLYRRLLDQGWAGLHATGHGGDVILIGELAPFGQSIGNAPGAYGEMVPLRFVRALYCVDGALHPLRGAAATLRGCPPTAAGSARFAGTHPALFQATGMAVHPYPGPNQIPPNVVLNSSSEFANLAALPNLERLLDSVAATYGSSRQLPLYSTEYGYFTNPPFVAGAPPTVAAAYLNWAEYITWRNGRIRSWDQYQLLDPPTGSPSKFATGLEFANGTHKPSYAAWRMPIYLPATRAHGRSSLEVWGCVRPARYAQLDTGRRQQAQIQLRAAVGSFKTVKTVMLAPASCYFDTDVRFAASGSVRLAWSYPHGPAIYSRGVPITVTS